MQRRRAVLFKLVPIAASGLLLSGCFATQSDLDPIKSDISVLEKQFMEVQRTYARSKYEPGKEGAVESEMGTRISDAYTRLAAVEKRLDMLERDVAGLKAAASSAPAPSETAPQGVAPAEPVLIEPIPPEKAEKAEKAIEPEAPQPTKGMVEAGDAFKGALDLYGSGDYDKAESAFNDFIARYPKDHLADDARYYIGDIYFAKKDFTRALAEYKRLLDDYPLADRVPDALFRSGMASEELKDPANAREFYTRVMDNYPYSDAAKKAKERLDALK